MGYSKDTFKGVSWVGALRISTRAITFIRIAILARLLSPAQFGIFGIGTLLLAFLEISTETGINVILIQERKELKEYVDAAWFVSIVRGIFISLLVILLAPFIATFFHTPDAYGLLLFISIIPLIRGVINPSIVRYQKDLEFHKEFWLRLSIFFLDSIVTIVMAFLYHNAYSFVWGLLAGAILEVLISFLFIKPQPRFHLAFEKVKYILHRGKWVTAYGIFQYIAEQGDNIAVGRILGTSPLGIYQVAYKFSTLPISEITDVVNKVVFPVYSRISEDKKRLLQAFFRTTIVITVASILLSGIIYFFSDEIIAVFLGKQWLAAIPVIKVLAVYGMVRAIFGSTSALFLAVRKQEYVTSMIFIRCLGLAVTIVPFTLWYGLVGAGYSALFSSLIELPIILFFLYKIFRKLKSV